MPPVDQGALTHDAATIVERVWEVLLRRELVADEGAASLESSPTGQGTFTAWCSLVGVWSGSVHLHCSREAARDFARWFLSDSEEELRDDDLADCLAELCNVICGNLKPALPGPTRLGLPAVVVGDDYRLRLPGGRTLIHLTCRSEGHRVDFVVVEQPEST